MRKDRIMIGKMFLLLICLCINYVYAENKVPTLYLNFDGNVNAQINEGTLKPIIEGKPVLVEGYLGGGLKVGEGMGYLVFDAPKAFSPKSGAISMWIKPLNWTTKSNGFHVFFDARGERNGIFLYKFFNDDRLLLLATKDSNKGPYSIAQKNINWNENEWHHLLAQWSNAKLELYVDGTLVGKENLPKELPNNLSGKFKLGDISWNSAPSGMTIIDEVKVFDTQLNSEQILSLHGDNKKNINVKSSSVSYRSNIDVSPNYNWKAIDVSGSEILLTDKKITLSDDGLPSEIYIKDKQILKSPMEININGLPLKLDRREKIIEYKNYGSKLFIEKKLVSNDISFNLDIVIEDDGLMSFDMFIAKLPETLIGGDVSLKVHLNNEYVRFLHMPGKIGSRNFDLLKNVDKLLATNYKPFIWIGDDNRGIFWFSETEAGWGNSESNDTIKIRKEADEWVFEVNIRPVPLNNGGWHHKFGFATTPVKILPNNWRKLRMTPFNPSNAYVVWPNEDNANFTYFGYPQSKTPVKFENYLKKLEKSGVIAAPYACPTWIATNTKEWEINQLEWSGGAADKTFNKANVGPQFVNVCPAKDSWQSYVKDKFGAFISDYKLKGIYMDNAQIYATKNCVTSDEDQSAKDYSLLSQRALYRFIENELRMNTERPLSIVHSSGGINAFSFSTALAWVNGEQYREVVNDDYLDIVTLTDFRVELNGKQWGFIPIFLPEFKSKFQKNIAPTRKLMSLLLIHDAAAWPLWSNVSEINRGYRMLDLFGIVDTDFVPYYNETPLATADKLDIYVSGYVKNDSALLIVANLSKTSKTTNLCKFYSNFDMPILQTWPQKVKVNINNGCANIRLDAGSYNMYLLSKSGNI